MLTREVLSNRFLRFDQALQQYADCIKNEILVPATEQEVRDIENQLGRLIPTDFRDVLLNVSKAVSYYWQCKDTTEFKGNLNKIFSGSLHWDLDELIALQAEYQHQLKHIFNNFDDEYDRIWHNKFVFDRVLTGDRIAIDLASGKIVYLSHDGDWDEHGLVLANSFSELLDNWTQVGCVGNEAWQWEIFCYDKQSGIEPNHELARLWRKTLKIPE